MCAPEKCNDGFLAKLLFMFPTSCQHVAANPQIERKICPQTSPGWPLISVKKQETQTRGVVL